MNLKNCVNPSILILFLGIGLISCAQKKPEDNTAAKYTDSSMVNRPDSFWKRVLNAEQYYILREKGTEKPYTGKWLMNESKGIYSCAACGNELFTSDMKFDSHCGWPSFDEEISGGKIKTSTDNSHGMTRTEITCANCGGHLGHLFDDGPTSSGKRYCVNSVSLEFAPATSITQALDTVVLGGGCFWCIEGVFEGMKGIQSTVSGYSGGDLANPTYEAVCTGNTGHAEVVQIIFDPNIVKLEDILEVFFTIHDPTTTDAQGADIGSQYRSIIFYKNQTQKIIIDNFIDELKKKKSFKDNIVTIVQAYKAFYKAEVSHQDYYKNNPDQMYCKRIIQPKIEKFEKLFGDKKK